MWQVFSLTHISFVRLFCLLLNYIFLGRTSVRVNKPPGEGDQEWLHSGKKKRLSGSAGPEAGHRPFWM